MSNQEYILAFESILYGLIVSKILQKWNYMLQDDPPKKHYWAFWVMTINLFLTIIFMYITHMWDDHTHKINDQLSFFYYSVLPPSLFTFSVYQIFPKEFKNVDLKEYLMRYRVRVFAPVVIYGILTQIEVLDFDRNGVVSSLVGMIVPVLCLIVIATKRYWVLEAFSIIFLLSLMFLYLPFAI